MHTLFTDVRKIYTSGFTFEIDRLEIQLGERVGLVGNNGAGKTTMLHLLLGLLRFRDGDIRLDGQSVREFSLSWRSQTSSWLDETSLIPFLEPWELWQFTGDAYGVDRTEQARRLKEYDGFIEFSSGRAERKKKKYIRDYSLGNRKKIGLVAAMMVRPRLLVLDEPFTNLDPGSRAALEMLLLRLHREHGATLIVSSHDLVNIIEVSSRILSIEAGRIVLDALSGAETLRRVQDRLTASHLRRAAIQEEVP